MIIQTIPSVRKAPPEKVYTPPHQRQGTGTISLIGENRPNYRDKARADQFKITPEEFVRRDKIVRQVYLDTVLGYDIGQVVRPATDQSFAEYGRLEIREIYKSYHDFPTLAGQDWPDDDKPFLLTVASEKKPDQLLCITAAYIKKLSKDGNENS